MIIIRKSNDDPYHNFTFNDDYQLVNSFGDIKTNTIDETIDYIEDNIGDNFSFEIEKCKDVNKYKVGLI